MDDPIRTTAAARGERTRRLTRRQSADKPAGMGCVFTLITVTPSQASAHQENSLFPRFAGHRRRPKSDRALRRQPAVEDDAPGGRDDRAGEVDVAAFWRAQEITLNG